MITRETIDRLYKYKDEIDTSSDAVTNEYSTIKANWEGKTHKIVRNIEGVDKEVDAPEDKLWYEVENLGSDCNAGNVLKKTYPKMFELVDTNNKIVKEMTDYAIKNVGVDPLKLTLIDIIRIIDGVIEGKKE